MKKLIFIALLVIAGYSTSYSQNKPIKYYSTEVMDEINATQEQRTAVKKLVAKYDILFKEVKANSSLTAEESKAETRKLIGERSREYWKILNLEQTKYLRDKAKGN